MVIKKLCAGFSSYSVSLKTSRNETYTIACRLSSSPRWSTCFALYVWLDMDGKRKRKVATAPLNMFACSDSDRRSSRTLISQYGLFYWNSHTRLIARLVATRRHSRAWSCKFFVAPDFDL